MEGGEGMGRGVRGPRRSENNNNNNKTVSASAYISSPVATCSQIKVVICCISSSIVQELSESRGGRPGLFVLTSLLVSVDVKNRASALVSACP